MATSEFRVYKTPAYPLDAAAEAHGLLSSFPTLLVRELLQNALSGGLEVFSKFPGETWDIQPEELANCINFLETTGWVKTEKGAIPKGTEFYVLTKTHKLFDLAKSKKAERQKQFEEYQSRY